MQGVERAVGLWLKILAVLLLLLGLVLIASPRIPYTTSEEIGHTGLKVKRDKMIIIPRPVATIIIGAGVITFILARRRPR